MKHIKMYCLEKIGNINKILKKSRCLLLRLASNLGLNLSINFLLYVCESLRLRKVQYHNLERTRKLKRSTKWRIVDSWRQNQELCIAILKNVHVVKSIALFSIEVHTKVSNFIHSFQTIWPHGAVIENINLFCAVIQLY